MKITQLDKTKDCNFLEITFLDKINNNELEEFDINIIYYLCCKYKSNDKGKLYIKNMIDNSLTLIQDDVELKLNILQALELFEPDPYEIYVVEDIINILTKQP